MASKYRNAGQTCVCANRILVQDRVYDAFAEKLAAAVQEAEGRRRHRGRRDHRPADQQGRGREGRGAHRRCGEEGRQGRGRRQAHALGGNFFEPTILRDVTPRHAGRPRGDLRPGRAALPLQDRGRGDRHGQRHRVRPRLLFLHPRHRPRLARRRGARIRHRRHQRRHHLDRGRALRRRQGIRHRPRRLAPRHRGISSRSNTC